MCIYIYIYIWMFIGTHIRNFHSTAVSLLIRTGDDDSPSRTNTFSITSSPCTRATVPAGAVISIRKLQHRHLVSSTSLSISPARTLKRFHSAHAGSGMMSCAPYACARTSENVQCAPSCTRFDEWTT